VKCIYSIAQPSDLLAFRQMFIHLTRSRPFVAASYQINEIILLNLIKPKFDNGLLVYGPRTVLQVTKTTVKCPGPRVVTQTKCIEIKFQVWHKVDVSVRIYDNKKRSITNTVVY